MEGETIVERDRPIAVVVALFVLDNSIAVRDDAVDAETTDIFGDVVAVVFGDAAGRNNSGQCDQQCQYAARTRCVFVLQAIYPLRCSADPARRLTIYYLLKLTLLPLYHIIIRLSTLYYMTCCLAAEQSLRHTVCASKACYINLFRCRLNTATIFRKYSVCQPL